MSTRLRDAVHCGPERIYVSALGAPDGIFLLDHDALQPLGRWEIDRGPPHLAYDFWWHIAHDVMLTSDLHTLRMYTTTPAVRTATEAPEAFGHVSGGQYTAHEVANLEAARRFLAAIEAGAAGAPAAEPEAALTYYTADARQVEFPNRFCPAGAERDVAALREASARGRGVMSGQRYEVRAAYAAGDTVILEVLWAGTLARPVGALAVGDEMRAHFAVFLEFRDGRIARHRTYDCFELF